MPSVKAHPAIVQQFIDSELREERMFGPFAPDEILYPVHISRFGIIEKKNQPRKFRLIVDLSYPPGMSVNDGISPELSSMSYTKVDDIVQGIWQSGVGSMLAKIDITKCIQGSARTPCRQASSGSSLEREIVC